MDCEVKHIILLELPPLARSSTFLFFCLPAGLSNVPFATVLPDVVHLV